MEEPERPLANGPGPREPEGDAPLGLSAAAETRHPRKLQEWTLVLRAMGIPWTSRGTGNAWQLLVADTERERAAQAIAAYEKENEHWPPPRTRERLLYDRSLSAPLVFLLLIAFFTWTGPARHGGPFFAAGRGATDLVLGSEPFRVLTALTLHVDVVHAVGNAISGTVFVGAVNRRLGPGLGWFVVLASGAAGNFANALYHGPGHASVGASTAVFGAVGVLASTQLVVNLEGPRAQGSRMLVAPLVGGLALLGALGAGPRSDLGAHLFGLLAGVVLGLAAGLALRGRARPLPAAAQGAFGAVSLLSVLGAWALALP